MRLKNIFSKKKVLDDNLINLDNNIKKDFAVLKSRVKAEGAKNFTHINAFENNFAKILEDEQNDYLLKEDAFVEYFKDECKQGHSNKHQILKVCLACKKDANKENLFNFYFDRDNGVEQVSYDDEPKLLREILNSGIKINYDALLSYYYDGKNIHFIDYPIITNDRDDLRERMARKQQEKIEFFNDFKNLTKDIIVKCYENKFDFDNYNFFLKYFAIMKELKLNDNREVLQFYKGFDENDYNALIVKFEQLFNNVQSSEKEL